MKLIDLHKKWMRKGVLPYNGLCNSLPPEYKKTLEFLKPQRRDMKILIKEDLMICSDTPKGYWASDTPIGLFTNYERESKYGPTRQSIVLLICAMHVEL